LLYRHLPIDLLISGGQQALQLMTVIQDDVENELLHLSSLTLVPDTFYQVMTVMVEEQHMPHPNFLGLPHQG
jgi:hypothetical protein